MAGGVDVELELSNIRGVVSQPARDGVRPRHGSYANRLDLAFKDKSDELERLDAIAVGVREASAAKDRAKSYQLKLQAMTDRILKEQAAAEQANRRALAEAEARKRLEALER